MMDGYIFRCGVRAEYISSRQNGRVTAASRLSDRKFREADGSFLCEGVKITLEAAEFGCVTEVFIREENVGEMDSVAAAAHEAGAEIFVLSSPAFDRITTEKSPQGVISVAKKPLSHTLWNGELPDSFVLMLDSVRDPGNLGTMLRSACAFGCTTAALCGCADPYGPRAVRASMGAVFKLDLLTVRSGGEFIRAINGAGRRTLAAALGDDSLVLGEFDLRRDDCIVIGNEGHGISGPVLAGCSFRVQIPMAENTESLNAAAAAAVLLWEYSPILRAGR